MINDALIRRESGQYDVEIISKLKLEKLSIQRIAGLERCVNLVELSLAWNDITDIIGLSELIGLQRLDLSHNRIKRVAHIEKLPKLEYLDLRANSIMITNDLLSLSLCSNLKKLYLQGPSKEDRNPVCETDRYQTIMMQYLPHLDVLDGERTALYHSSRIIDDLLDDMKLEESKQGETLPTENWIDPGNELESKDNLILSQSIAASCDNITNQISVNCKELLKLADQVINNARK